MDDGEKVTTTRMMITKKGLRPGIHPEPVNCEGTHTVTKEEPCFVGSRDEEVVTFHGASSSKAPWIMGD